MADRARERRAVRAATRPGMARSSRVRRGVPGRAGCRGAAPPPGRDARPCHQASCSMRSTSSRRAASRCDAGRRRRRAMTLPLRPSPRGPAPLMLGDLSLDAVVDCANAGRRRTRSARSRQKGENSLLRVARAPHRAGRTRPGSRRSRRGRRSIRRGRSSPALVTRPGAPPPPPPPPPRPPRPPRRLRPPCQRRFGRLPVLRGAGDSFSRYASPG